MSARILGRIAGKLGEAVAAASETVAGIAEIASQAETDAGTDDGRIVSPLKLADATSVSLPRSYLAGLTLSNNATDATNDIDIAVGEARSTADDKNLVVASAIGKQIDVTFAPGGTPGAPTGGRSSSVSLTNDTTYHVILGLVSGTVEVGFDTSITGANLVTDHSFTNTRRIGSIERGTATNLAFSQVGDEFLFDDPPLDIDVVSSTTGTLRTLTVPLGIQVWSLLNVFAGIGIFTYISSPDMDDEAPSQTAGPLLTVGVAAGDNLTNGWTRVRTNTSSQVRSRDSAGAQLLRIATLGYIDRRGRDD